jgi:hypothetical protein
VNSSTAAADRFNSADTFVEVTRVGISTTNYTSANVTAAFEFF